MWKKNSTLPDFGWKSLASAATKTKEYIVELANQAADGLGRVLSVESYANAAKGMMRLGEEGKVEFVGCFASGTLVHTDRGLVPIEMIRVGTRVLSQPEQGGERDYRPVINKVAHLDQPVMAIQLKAEGSDAYATLIATGNHPFWVADAVAETAPHIAGEHWLAAESLQAGMTLQLADGRKAVVHAAALIRHTQYAHLGFAGDDRAGVGVVVDFSEKQLKVADDALLLTLDKLELGEPYLTPVYNFEVEGFHTYYVGGDGVWVHNTNCAKTEALQDVGYQASFSERINAIEEACFDGETPVHIRINAHDTHLFEYVLAKGEISRLGLIGKTISGEIWHLQPGIEVLSRCETTGEIGYRKITRVFEHESQEVYELTYSCDVWGSVNLLVTGNHPIWVIDKGWVKVEDLNVGDEFLTSDGTHSHLIALKKERFKVPVYNIEVEDFHTYFVGPSSGLWVHNKNAQVKARALDVTAKGVSVGLLF